MNRKSNQATYWGIDVSRKELEICVLPKGTWYKVANTPKGIKDFILKVRRFNPQSIVIESTGKYHLDVSWSLYDAGLPLSVVNPRLTRNFAECQGIIAKTDKIDARVLADYGQKIRPPLSEFSSELIYQMRELVKHRRDLVHDRERCTKRLDGLRNSVVLKSLKRQIKWLAKEINRVELAIEESFLESEELTEIESRLIEIPGVKYVTSRSILCELPELGRLNRKEIAALGGLSPYNRDSGKMSKHRFIRSGRSQVRRSLYLSALSASHHAPGFKEYYNRLVSTGKQKKVAVIAVARKLLTVMNAMVRDGTHWDPKLVRSRI